MKRNAAMHIGAATLLAAAARGQSFHTDFDDVATLPALGWVFTNASMPAGLTGWYQGSLGDFAPQASLGFIETDYTCGQGIATLNNWMLAPVRMLQNGDTFQFWTRTLFEPAPFADRLQLRLSTAGSSTLVGTPGLPTSVGDFDTLLLDINPLYLPIGFPAIWTQYTVVLSGLPAGGISGRFAFRYFVENGGPLGLHGSYVGIDSVDYVRGGLPWGACCLNDGSCQSQTAIGCAGIGGTYRGDGTDCQTIICPSPPTGACCRPNGTCVVVNSFQCAAIFGVYNGEGSTCGSGGGGCQPFGFVETTEAGGLPGTAAPVNGPANTALTRIFGHMNPGDTDMFSFRICDHAAFSASTLSGSLDTQLFLFDSSGYGIVMDDDGPQGEPGSIITGASVPWDGKCYLAVTLYNRDPLDTAAKPIWSNTNPAGGFYPEWAPNGPGATNAVAGWSSGNQESGDYTITLTGSCFLGAAFCYPNCDGSSATPVLNANDFQCFLNNFVTLNPYANCDASTTPPTLNANDFQCFLNAFALGCS